MTSTELKTALANAEDAFQRRPENPDVGLEYVSDPDVLQLRKACRLLDAASFLLDRNSHYTVIGRENRLRSECSAFSQHA